MSEHNSVNEEIRAQREKLKGQGFKAKWEYFWEYYKIHTIVAIVVVIFLVSLINQIANKKPYALYAMYINCLGTMDTQTSLQNGFYEYLGKDRSQEEVVIDTASTFNSTNLDTSAVATSEKIMAFSAASDLDVVMSDPATFFHFAGQDFFQDLRDIFSPDELENFGDNVFYIDRRYIEYIDSDEYDDYILTHEYDNSNKYAVMAAEFDETGVYTALSADEMEDPIPVGIILDNSSALKESGVYYENPPVAGIVVNTARNDNAKMFIEYMAQ